MPQGERTEKEKAEFDMMLPNINLLYLGATVLVLMDLSYLSRFWTQFEAWCSMQKCTTEGCSARRRPSGAPWSSASTTPPTMRNTLVGMGGNVSAQQAYEVLKSPTCR